MVLWAQQTMLTASYMKNFSYFGTSIALSGDGNSIIIGASQENCPVTGVNGDESTTSIYAHGAAYIYTRAGAAWSKEAFLKPYYLYSSLTFFGASVAISYDGNTVAVCNSGDDSYDSGINTEPPDYWGAGDYNYGSVLVYYKTGTTWAKQSYIKPAQTKSGNSFGYPVVLSSDGNTLAAGVPWDDSSSTGSGGNPINADSASSGAMYIFTRSGATWSQQAYIKASNTGGDDRFSGFYEFSPYAGQDHAALSADGNTLAVGAFGEDSKATGVNGDQWDNSSGSSGAVYVFTRSGVTWSQQAYIKASNTGLEDFFGVSVALSGDGDTLAVGAQFEDSKASGLNGNQWDNSSSSSGAVYLFTRTGGVWTQSDYVKASRPVLNGYFGWSVSLNYGGTRLLVGCPGQSSAGNGVNSLESSGSAVRSGAGYLFEKISGSWSQIAFIKGPTSRQNDYLGWSCSCAANTSTIALGAREKAVISGGGPVGAVCIYTDLDDVEEEPEEPEEEETTTVSSLERKPQKEKSKTKKLISSKEFADIFEREKKQKEQQRFTNLLINNEDWIRRKENLTYTLGDYLFVPIETNYFDIGEKEIFQQRVQEAIYTVYTRILDSLNKQRNDELIYKYFKYVDYHLDFYPGAKLKFLIAIEKKDLEVFKEKEKKRTATVINLKAGEVLKKLDVKKLEVYNSSFGTIIKNGK